MVDCEMCGKRDISPVRAMIEGTAMVVCDSCAKYGKRLVDHSRKVTSREKKIKKGSSQREDPDKNKVLVDKYNILIKQAREKRGLKQEEVAKRLNEKESLIHKVESGQFRPRLQTIRKFERFFSVKLIEEFTEKERPSQQFNSPEEKLTMGDLLKKAMEKKK